MHGRHRRLGRIGALPLAAAVVVLVMLAGAGLLLWLDGRSTPGTCHSGLTVTVAAAPEIAPAIRAAVGHLPDNTNSASCATYVVNAVEPADIAAVLAQSAGATLTGLGQAAGTVHAPDVWIPDSSIWLRRLIAKAPGVVPAAAPSIAQSPLVLAMPQPVAVTLGWPDTQLSWDSLLPKLLGESGLHPGIVDPDRDVTGLAGLLALRAAAPGINQDQEQVVLGGMRILATGRATLRADLLSQFPRAGDVRTVALSLSVAPLPEQAVIGYDAAEPPVPLVAVPFGGGAPALDYPYVVLPGDSSATVDRAQLLLSALTGPAYAQQLAAVGLRTRDGGTGAGFTTPPGTPSAAPAAGPAADPAVIDATLATWGSVTGGQS